jgi:cell wall-associated NlpC family hydrolase
VSLVVQYAKIKFAAAAIPPVMMCGLMLVIGGAGANGSLADVLGCAGGGTAQQVGDIYLGPEQMGNARTIVEVAASRGVSSWAATIAVVTALQESSLRNSTVMVDHDSIGLFQQRVSIYTAEVAADPVKATNAFLDRLIALPGWDQMPLTDAAARVQNPSADLRGEYAKWQDTAERLVAQFWNGAVVSATPTPSATGSSGPTSSMGPSAGPSPTTAICPGDGAGTGDVVAGSANVPDGFVINGTEKGKTAVKFALEQLGEPYVFGAAGPDSWDCSGLTMGAWAAAGIALPHWTGTQVDAGTPEPTDLSQAVGGDLVFIPGADGTPSRPGHVAMVAGYVDGKDGRHLYIIQAPQTGDVVKLTDASNWNGQITDVRHIA